MKLIKFNGYIINLYQITYMHEAGKESERDYTVYVYFDSDVAAPIAFKGNDARQFMRLVENYATLD